MMVFKHFKMFASSSIYCSTTFQISITVRHEDLTNIFDHPLMSFKLRNLTKIIVEPEILAVTVQGWSTIDDKNETDARLHDVIHNTYTYILYYYMWVFSYLSKTTLMTTTELLVPMIKIIIYKCIYQTTRVPIYRMNPLVPINYNIYFNGFGGSFVRTGDIIIWY